MSNLQLNTYLAGMVTASFLASGLFFLKFWWRSRDLLFVAFAVAFWLLALNAALVVMWPEPHERRTWFYLLRVAAFLLIAAAIVRKNAAEPGED
ncbi:MAG: DUF5985 family protein [Acetobacteraceae bacterium]